MISYKILKQFSILLTSILITLSSPVLLAHDGKHGKVIAESEAPKIAQSVIAKAIEKGALPASWKEAKMVNTKMVRPKRHDAEWMIAFENPSIKDASKRTVYVFLDLDGKYLAMNFEGE